MKKSKSIFIVLLLSVAIVLTSFNTVEAQQAKAEFTLEEIVVTAERRESSAQDTPVAVTAWDANTIDEQNIAGNMDLQIRMPSTFINATSVTIRSVGYRSVYLGVDVGVGIFSDGFYNEHSAEVFSDLFDVERMENVRGPQSTLYGKSTIGGAINVIEKKPTKEWSGQFKASFGNYERRNFQAAFGGPILMDNLYYRVLLHDIWFGGDQEAVFLGDDEYVNTRDRYRVGLKLLYEPTDDLSFYLRYNLTDANERPRAVVVGDSWHYQAGLADPIIPSKNEDYISYFSFITEGSPGSRYRNAIFGMADVYGDNPSVNDPHKVANNYAGNRGRDERQVDLTADLNLGNFTFKAMAMYRDWNYNNVIDQDYGPNPDANKILTYDYNDEDWSAEFQVLYGAEDSPISAIGGIFYFKRLETHNWYRSYYGDWYWETEVPHTYYSYIAMSTITFTPLSDKMVYGLFPELEDVSKAAYTQINYDITDTLTLGLGLRYAIDEKKGYEWRYYLLFGPYGTPNVNPTAAAAGYSHALNTPDGMGYYDDDGTFIPLEAGQYLLSGVPYEYYNQANSTRNHKGDWQEWLWHVGLDWKPTDDILLYGKVDKGYKPGGFPLAAFQQDNFDAEFIVAYEMGWKQLWMDSRFSTIIDYFFYDYTDMQLSTMIGNDVLVNNASKASVYGLEFEGTGFIIENLLGSISYSWNNAEYDEYSGVFDQYEPNKGYQDLSGNTAPFTPEHKFTLNLTYTIPTDLGDFAVHGLFFWQDEIYSSQFNIPERRVDAYSRVDADISWNSPAYKWRVTLWTKNLLDDDILHSVTLNGPSDGFERTVTYADPRYIGIDISYKW